MKKITLLFVLFSCIGYAQNDTFDGRILSLKDGGSITIGEDLKIGKGTKDNGYFRYIEVMVVCFVQMEGKMLMQCHQNTMI